MSEAFVPLDNTVVCYQSWTIRSLLLLLRIASKIVLAVVIIKHDLSIFPVLYPNHINFSWVLLHTWIYQLNNVTFILLQDWAPMFSFMKVWNLCRENGRSVQRNWSRPLKFSEEWRLSTYKDLSYLACLTMWEDGLALALAVVFTHGLPVSWIPWCSTYSVICLVVFLYHYETTSSHINLCIYMYICICICIHISVYIYIMCTHTCVILSTDWNIQGGSCWVLLCLCINNLILGT